MLGHSVVSQAHLSGIAVDISRRQPRNPETPSKHTKVALAMPFKLPQDRVPAKSLMPSIALKRITNFAEIVASIIFTTNYDFDLVSWPAVETS